MRGTRINIAKKALRLFIRSIPPNSKFNIVSFGSRYELMYPNSIEYNNENMQDALNRIILFEANFGKTELFESCQHVLSQPNDEKYPRNVFILTDGDISDKEVVLNIIKGFSHKTRVHSFGIGSGASIYLIKEIAKEGKGLSTLVEDNDENLYAKIIKALKYAARPALTSFDIDWSDNTNSIILFGPLPPKIPMIYEEESFNLYAIMSEEDLWASTVKLSFFNTLCFCYQMISIEIDQDKIQESRTGKEFQFAAKHYLNYLNSLNKTEKEFRESEIIEMSVMYSVLTPKTAFFGFIKNKSNSNQQMKTVEWGIRKFRDKIDNWESHSSSSDSSNHLSSQNSSEDGKNF